MTPTAMTPSKFGRFRLIYNARLESERYEIVTDEVLRRSFLSVGDGWRHADGDELTPMQEAQTIAA